MYGELFNHELTQMDTNEKKIDWLLVVSHWPLDERRTTNDKSRSGFQPRLESRQACPELVEGMALLR